MIRELLAAGIVFAVGYFVGVMRGYRAAVVDYVENDAEEIEEVAAEVYPSPEDGGQAIPREIQEAIREAEEHDSDDEADSSSTEGRGFQ